MSAGFISLIACALIGAGVMFHDRFIRTDWKGNHSPWYEAARFGAAIFAICAAVVLAVWLVAAVPVSAIQRKSCQREAAGYGLDYDWSFRNYCRIELPTGQLVPSDNIRITSDGEIVNDH
jgi:hypothetical protein